MAKKRAHRPQPTAAQTTKTSVDSDLDAEFIRLFNEARKEHGRLEENATGNEPAHQSVLAFAQAQGWAWAAYLLEANRLRWVGKNSEAAKSLRKIVRAVPARHRGLFLFVRGATLHAQGKLDEAVAAYQQGMATPDCNTLGDTWHNLGIVLRAQGKPVEAEAAYRQALATPGYDTPGLTWNNLGVALKSRDKLDEAVDAYKKALASPEFKHAAIAWTNLAAAYEKTGNLKEARSALEKVLTLPDDGRHALARLGLQRLRAGLKAESLSPDDRALSSQSAVASKRAEPATAADAAVAGVEPMKMLTVSNTKPDSLEDDLIAAIREAGETQYEKYIKVSDSKRNDTLSILRGWSSAVTLLEGSERRWRGGGYFLKWRGYGIVIDPGFDFLLNIHDAK